MSVAEAKASTNTVLEGLQTLIWAPEYLEHRKLGAAVFLLMFLMGMLVFW